MDNLWARYLNDDQLDYFLFLKHSFLHRVYDMYNFQAKTNYYKDMFILVFLLHTNEKPYKCRMGRTPITHFLRFTNIW